MSGRSSSEVLKLVCFPLPSSRKKLHCIGFVEFSLLAVHACLYLRVGYFAEWKFILLGLRFFFKMYSLLFIHEKVKSIRKIEVYFSF